MKLTIKKTLKYVAAGIVCALYVSPVFAADTNHDLLTVESAENVRFSSQEIAKAYFYKQQAVRSDRASEDLKTSLARLKKDLIIIKDGLKESNKEEQNIVVYLEYTLEELFGLVDAPYSKDNGALMIDYSESLLEGAELVAKQHMHKQNSEEGMLVATEELLFLLERINKFYIAYQAGFDDYNNVVQLKRAVQDFEVTLAQVNTYTKYADGTLESRNKINEFWPVAKEFFIDVEKGALPVIVLASVEKLEKELKVLEDFHHNNAI
ncbi:MAG: hypothetical protein Q3M24_19050 [Candidatus Electrothrix aestuarii]|uniref:Type IV pili methyl-accepting chemotaxis transducer N-term n=1 Tax=Candidatus Electrothrix aestuarii TaxID=3062594 RepID=A0AAU8LTA7_9BACT